MSTNYYSLNPPHFTNNAASNIQVPSENNGHNNSNINSNTTTPQSSSSSVNNKPRKSNLTQQQKNKKRQRATSEQLEVLRQEFAKNSTPTAKTRDEIGRRIDMTERSVQIWFQNKRAKVKLAKKQEVSNTRNFSLHSSGGGGGENLMIGSGGGYYSSPGGMSRFSSPLDSSQSASPGIASTGEDYKNNHHPSSNISETYYHSGGGVDGHYHSSTLFAAPPILLSCSELVIGTWSRVLALDSNDLRVQYLPSESLLTYTVLSGDVFYRVALPFKAVENVRLIPDGNQPTIGHVLITLNDRRPSFWVRPNGKRNWLNVFDYTENKQGSSVKEHRLIGPFVNLQGELCRLFSFQPGKFAENALTPPIVGSLHPPAAWPPISTVSGRSGNFDRSVDEALVQLTDQDDNLHSTNTHFALQQNRYHLQLYHQYHMNHGNSRNNNNQSSNWLDVTDSSNNIPERFETKSTPANVQYACQPDQAGSNVRTMTSSSHFPIETTVSELLSNETFSFGANNSTSQQMIYGNSSNNNNNGIQRNDDLGASNGSGIPEGGNFMGYESSPQGQQESQKGEFFIEYDDYKNGGNHSESKRNDDPNLSKSIDYSSVEEGREKIFTSNQPNDEASADGNNENSSNSNQGPHSDILGLTSPPMAMSPMIDGFIEEKSQYQYILETNPTGSESSMLLDGFTDFSFGLDESGGDNTQTGNNKNNDYDSSLFI